MTHEQLEFLNKVKQGPTRTMVVHKGDGKHRPKTVGGGCVERIFRVSVVAPLGYAEDIDRWIEFSKYELFGEIEDINFQEVTNDS